MPSSYILLLSVIVLAAVACSGNARPMQHLGRDQSNEETQAQWRSNFPWPSGAKAEQAQIERISVADYIKALQGGRLPLGDQEQKKSTEQSFNIDLRPLQNLLSQYTPSAKQQLQLSGLHDAVQTIIRNIGENKRDEQAKEQTFEDNFRHFGELIGRMIDQSKRPSMSTGSTDQAQKETFGWQDAFNTFQGLIPRPNEKDKASEEVFFDRFRPFQKTAAKLDDQKQQNAVQQIKRSWPWSRGTRPTPTTPYYMYDTTTGWRRPTTDYNMYGYEELMDELQALEDE